MITPVNIGTDHIRGSIDAPISIVEYGDYECPYAGMTYLIGTPTFFVNGERYEDSWDLETFSNFLKTLNT